MAESYIPSDLPVQISNVVFNPVAESLTFNIKIRALCEGHKALLAASATNMGATLGSVAKAATGTANATTGDVDMAISLTW